MTGDPHAVALEGVTVRFPRRPEPVLRDVTAHLAPGEQVVVLGPSGSGKSTLLHAVTGVVPHTVDAELTGSVHVAGTATAQTTVVERSRHVGVLAQDPRAAVCLPGVEQELVLALENHAADPATIDARVTAALDAVGAAALRPRATAGLSGGELQRVALAAALVTEPAVLLLDEPTSMLDPAGVRAVRGAVHDAARQYRPAVVLVEHRLDEWAGADGVAGLPARALVLDGAGRVLADGATADVLREHAARLHAAGCWLPLEAELLALTGAGGGLADPVNAAFLRHLARPVPSASPGPVAPPAHVARVGAPVVTARRLAVGRAARGRGRRGGRRSGAPVPEPVLTGVDLSLRPGEVVALLGANGVGKTTLLLTLAGLLEPLAGDVAGTRPGLVFQNPEHQFLATTVRAEVAHGLPAEHAAAVAEDRLRRHRLGHLAEQNPFRLSGGEKRRLSLAAMLAHERPALLADEPTLGLDRRDTIATVAALRRAAAAGTAVLLASHDLRTVAALADRVVLLGDGGVLADGPTAEILADDAALTRAGIALPALVRWLLRHLPPPALAPVLRALDETVPTADDAPVPAGAEGPAP